MKTTYEEAVEYFKKTEYMSPKERDLERGKFLLLQIPKTRHPEFREKILAKATELLTP